MPAYTFRSVGTVLTSNTSADMDLSTAAPAGRQSGDLLLLYTAARGGTAVSNSISGYTLIKDYGIGGVQAMELWGRIADGTSADLPTVNWAGTTGYSVAWIEAWYGDVWQTLSTILAHSGEQTATVTDKLPLPAVSSVTTDNCLVIGFGMKNNTDTGYTVSHAALTTRVSHSPGSSSQFYAASGSLQQTTAADFDGTDFTLSTADASLAGRGFVVYLKSEAATTKYLKLLAHSSAASASSVAGVVFSAPTGGAITGTTRYGEFTNKTFEATLESGKAVLKVPVADFGGSALTTSDTPVALVRNTTKTTGIISCTVIEE